jgi:cytochrome c oxidase cbb3-type subunit III
MDNTGTRWIARGLYTRRLAQCLALIAIVACGGGAAAGGGRNAGAGAAAVAGDSGPPSVRYEQHVFAGGIAPPAATLTNPFRRDARSAKEGEQLFKTMNCDGCHGGGAEGWVGPSLSDGRWRYGGADGAVYQSIYYGRPEGMPAYGGVLTPPLAWKIVTYLSSLTPPKAVPTQSW